MICTNDRNVLNYVGSGIICLGSASAFLGMSTRQICPTNIYHDKMSKLKNVNMIVNEVPNIYGTEDTVLVDNVRITNKERTICEMIKYDTEDEFIIQSISHYASEHDLNTLREYAKKYNVSDKLEFWIDETEEYYADM